MTPIDVSDRQYAALHAELLLAGQMAVKRSRDGEFFPFGAALTTDSKIQVLAPPPDSNQTTVEPSIEKLLAHFREHAAAAAITAFGICLVVKDMPPGAMAKTISNRPTHSCSENSL